MKIVVNDQVCLSEFRWSDKDALIAHLNDPDIYHRTLRIPFPYTDASVDEWLALVAKITEQQGRPVQGKRFQIGNDRGRINGWVGENSIFGKCTKVE
jgi:hypothetical protein